MILSHTKNFIFIHIFKAAGNNIRAELRDYSHTTSIKNKVKCFLGLCPSYFSGDLPNHATASQVKEFLPNSIFDSYFKFAFVRNPWSWQVSLFHFMQQTPTHHQHSVVKSMNFDQYLDWRVNSDLKFQKDFIYDASGNLLVDYVGKVENIQQDFNNICEIVNIPQRTLGTRNNSIHKPYTDYYSEGTKIIVQEAFFKDITLFNYTFET